MRRIFALAAFLACSLALAAPDWRHGMREPLWPEGKIPDFQSHQVGAMSDELSTNAAWRAAHRMPYLEWFDPPLPSARGCMILVSGGSYVECCDTDLIRVWRDTFAKLGYQTVNLVYRTPRPKGLPIHQSAWEDGQRAVRLVRSQAKVRGFDPERIGIVGMSAGGHLVTMLATSALAPAYAKVDALDDIPCHVNWCIAFAPAYNTLNGANGDGTPKDGISVVAKINPCFKFDAKTCPISFHHGGRDSWSPNGSTLCYRELRKRGIPAELHLYADRTHGAHGLERAIAFVNRLNGAGESRSGFDVERARRDLKVRGLDPDADGVMGPLAEVVSRKAAWAMPVGPMKVLPNELAADTPPMCFMCGGEDEESALNAVACWEKLRALGVQCDLHAFAGRMENGVWMDCAWDFLRRKGFCDNEPKMSVFADIIRLTAVTRKISLAAAADLLYNLGVRGFDCSVSDKDLAALAATKLKPVNLYCSLHSTADDGSTARARALETAVKYGVPQLMVIPPNFTKGGDAEREFVRDTACLKAFVAQAAARGVTVTVEDFGDARNACSRMKYIRRMVGEIPDLRVTLDSGNLHYAGSGDDIRDMLWGMGDRIAHVHLKDLAATNRREFVSLGLGAVPNKYIVRELRANGYGGWFTLENTVGDPLEDVKRQIAVLRAWSGSDVSRRGK